MTKPSSNSHPDRPAALFLTPEAPYPAFGGGAQRIASIMEYVGKRYATDALVFRQPGAADPHTAFPPGLIREVMVIELPTHSKTAFARGSRAVSRMLRGVPPLVDRFAGFERDVARLLNGKQYDLGIVEHFWGAPYQRLMADHCRRLVLDLHNIESELHRRSSRQGEPFLVSAGHKRFATLATRMERDLLPRYHEMLATSESDAALARLMNPDARIHVMPNAIPFAPQPRVAPLELVAFSGNLEYHPNQAAVRYFRRQIWPVLRERFPSLRWRVIGMHPEAIAADTSGDPRIETTGMVPEALPVLAEAKVAVVPLLAGSGTRIKILEAWAAGVPVVSTTIGAEGLGAKDGHHLLIADSADRFIAAVGELLTLPELHQRIGTCGRAFYESHFTWEAAWDALGRAGL